MPITLHDIPYPQDVNLCGKQGELILCLADGTRLVGQAIITEVRSYPRDYTTSLDLCSLGHFVSLTLPLPKEVALLARKVLEGDQASALLLAAAVINNHLQTTVK